MLAKKGLLRLLGLPMGVAAGFSFVMMVFPYGMVRLYGDLPFELTQLMGLAGPITLMWTVGGAVVSWYGGGWRGATLLGLCGAISGTALATGVGGGSDVAFTLSGALVGLLYGTPAGILLGLAFPADQAGQPA